MRADAMTEIDDRLFYAWIHYYVDTETFDRTLPGKWSPHDSDVWLPDARFASIIHAHRVRERVQIEHRVRLTNGAARDAALKLTHAARVHLFHEWLCR